MSDENHDDQDPNSNQSGGAHEAQQNEGIARSITETLLIEFGLKSGERTAFNIGLESLLIAFGFLAGFGFGISSHVDMPLVFECTAIGLYVGMSAWLIAYRLRRKSFPSAIAVWA